MVINHLLTGMILQVQDGAPSLVIIKGSLEVKLPTIWRVEKQSREAESEEEEKRREVESQERKYSCARVRRKKIHPREMLGKSRTAVFFQRFVVPEGRKVGSLKRRVRR